MRHKDVVKSCALALFTAELGVRLLAPRKRSIEPAEVDLSAYFTREEIERGARFSRPQLALALARSAVELGLLGLVVHRNPRPLQRAAEVECQEIAGAATAAVLALGLSLAPLPLAAISRRRAISVGLVTQPWRGWANDLAKATGIEVVLAGGAGAAIVTLTRRYPRGWWAIAGGGSVIVAAAFTALGPVILDPVFNDFTPLQEGETRSDVLALASAAEVAVGEVYSVDASRRSTAANAYVAGLGPTKRVVLFDTLLDRYERDQVRVVVAHELAHVRHRDVARGITFAALVAPAGARAAQRLSWAIDQQQGTASALPALALSAAIVSVPIGLIANRLSRALERRADAYSLELSGAPDAFVSFERGIALQNFADLSPPRWLTALLSTHPPTGERIGAALAFKTRAGASPPP